MKKTSIAIYLLIIVIIVGGCSRSSVEPADQKTAETQHTDELTGFENIIAENPEQWDETVLYNIGGAFWNQDKTEVAFSVIKEIGYSLKQDTNYYRFGKEVFEVHVFDFPSFDSKKTFTIKSTDQNKMINCKNILCQLMRSEVFLWEGEKLVIKYRTFDPNDPPVYYLIDLSSQSAKVVNLDIYNHESAGRPFNAQESYSSRSEELLMEAVSKIPELPQKITFKTNSGEITRDKDRFEDEIPINVLYYNRWYTDVKYTRHDIPQEVWDKIIG